MRGLSTQSAPFIRLVVHDLRLAWRGFLDMFAFIASPRRSVIIAWSGIIGLHLMAWPVAGLAALQGADSIVVFSSVRCEVLRTATPSPSS